jgi:hypothetical protein
MKTWRTPRRWRGKISYLQLGTWPTAEAPCLKLTELHPLLTSECTMTKAHPRKGSVETGQWSTKLDSPQSFPGVDLQARKVECGVSMYNPGRQGSEGDNGASFARQECAPRCSSKVPGGAVDETSGKRGCPVGSVGGPLIPLLYYCCVIRVRGGGKFVDVQMTE